MNRSSADILQEYSQNEPNVLGYVNPSSAEAKECKDAFLAGSARHPGHSYAKLTQADFWPQRSKVVELFDELPHATDANELLTPTYREYLSWGLSGFNLLSAARRYNASTDGFLATLAGNDYMELSRRYGKPEVQVYHGIVNDLLAKQGVELLTPAHARAYDELLTMLPSPSDTTLTAQVNIDPAARDWVSAFVDAFYERLLRYVPEQEEFTPAEMVMWFTVILRREYGAAASDWRVEFGETSSVSVLPHQKLVRVSPNRANASLAKMRALVAHELGVHLMRSLMGSSTNIPILGWGLPGYRDAEEGLAIALEEALSGEYQVRGVPLYLSASLAYLEGYDFRDVYERMWRFSYVTSNPESIEKAQSVGYNRTRRIFRGTDRLPFLADLAYYNGYVKVWRHLEKVAGSEEHFRLLLLGKYDPENNNHRRVALEAASCH